MNLFEKEDRDRKFAELYAIMVYKKLIDILDVPDDLRAQAAVFLVMLKEKMK